MASITRRDLLWQGGRALGAATLINQFGLMSAMAQTGGGDYKALVCILLDGGNDAWNMITPYETTAHPFDSGNADEYQTYANARRQAFNASGAPLNPLALGQSDLLPVNSGLYGGRQYGFNGKVVTDNVYGNPAVASPAAPAMSELRDLYGANDLAVVANLGTLITPISSPAVYRANSSVRPRALFDHNLQKLTWQELEGGDGWGNSIGKLMNAFSWNAGARIPMLMNVTGGASVFLAGTEPYITLPYGRTLTLSGATLPAPTSANPLPNYTDTRYQALQALLNLRGSEVVVDTISDKTSKAIADGRVASQAIGTSFSYPAFGAQVTTSNSLATQLLQIARMIEKRNDLNQNNRQIFFASIGGFDTHDTQVADVRAGSTLLGGYHHVLMRRLSKAMKAFQDTLNAMGIADNVTTFTISDFGRTVQQAQSNNNVGTDHAWGSHALVMGGAVNGGRFYGDYPSLRLGGANDVDTGTGARGRILPTTSVDQYAGTLAKWFGLNESQIDQLLPNLDQWNGSGRYLNFV